MSHKIHVCKNCEKKFHVKNNSKIITVCPHCGYVYLRKKGISDFVNRLLCSGGG